MSLDTKLELIGMIVVVTALLFALLGLWAVCRAISRVLDRRPRESVRCSKCWYDLRGITAGDCPECGLDLTRAGVWPPGKPVRRHWVNALGFWTAAILILAVPGTWYFYQATRVVTYSLNVRVQESGDGADWAFTGTRSGEKVKWPLVPLGSVQPTAMSIVLRDADPQGILWYELDARTGVPVGTPYFTGPQPPLPTGPLTRNILIQQWKATTGQDPDTEMTAHMETAVEVLEAMLDIKSLAADMDEATSAWWTARLKQLSSPRHRLNVSTGTYGSEAAPLWVACVPTLFAFIVWLIGCVAITLWFRRRSLARWAEVQVAASTESASVSGPSSA